MIEHEIDVRADGWWLDPKLVALRKAAETKMRAAALHTVTDDEVFAVEALNPHRPFKAEVRQARKLACEAATRQAARRAKVTFARRPVGAPTDTSAEAISEWVNKNALAATPLLMWWAYLRTARELRQDLERRVAALEEALQAKRAPAFGTGEINFAGEFSESRVYDLGQVVRHDGDLWRAEKATAGEPGSPGAPWQRVVKVS
jgi:hypothetical protein